MLVAATELPDTEAGAAGFGFATFFAAVSPEAGSVLLDSAPCVDLLNERLLDGSLSFGFSFSFSFSFSFFFFLSSSSHSCRWY